MRVEFLRSCRLLPLSGSRTGPISLSPWKAVTWSLFKIILSPMLLACPAVIVVLVLLGEGPALSSFIESVAEFETAHTVQFTYFVFK